MTPVDRQAGTVLKIERVSVPSAGRCRVNVPTVTELLLARADDEHPGLRFEDETYSWAEHVRASARRAGDLRQTLRWDEPPHVGILADNVPAFSVLLGA